MEMKIVATTVAIAVTVIILAVMTPIITESADSIISTSENDTDGAITYRVTANAPDITISVGSGTIDVNDYSLTPTRQTILVACDSFCVFTFNTTGLYVLHSGAYDNVKASTDVVLSGTTLTYTKNGDSTETTRDVSGDVIYATNENANYVGYMALTTFNMDANEKVFFFGNPVLSNSSLSPASLSPIAFGFGTIEDLEYKLFNSEISASTIELASEPESESGHLEVTNSFTASVTNTTGTYTTEGSTYGAYVPIQYQDITSQDANMRTLINIIPVLLVVAILMLAVGLVIRSRM